MEVIQGAGHGYKDMNKEDALAIADYLKSIRADKKQNQLIKHRLITPKLLNICGDPRLLKLTLTDIFL